MTTSNDDFWGESADWPDAPQGQRREPRASAGKTVSRWWNKAVAGGTTGNRQHGGSRSSAPLPEDLDDEPLSVRHSGEHPVVHRAPADAPPTAVRRPGRPSDTPAHAADDPDPRDPPSHGGADDLWDDDWEVEPDPAPRPGVDPLLARLGGAAIVLTLFVPLFLGVGSGDGEPAVGADTEQPAVTLLAPADIASTAPVDAAVVTAAPATQPAAQEAPATTPNTNGSSNVTPVTTVTTTTPQQTSTTPSVAADAPTESSTVLATGALASGNAERVEQNCANDYTVVAGDFWIRLADASGVPIAELLDANEATSDTPLYPGSTICLPAGASFPSPPTTAAPAPTAPATTAKPVTTPTPTTAAPTTVRPVTYPTPSAAAVQQSIRDVWPDELEDRAIEIADRESNFVATARNSCCYGVFQMHWEAHKSWLTGAGITSPDQLFDVTTNAYVAYALYLRSGGWGPWT